MAHGDEQTVDFGPFVNWTRRSIDITAGTGVTAIVPAQAGSVIQLGPSALTFIGSGDADLIEADGETYVGPFEIGANADGLTLKLDGSEGIKTATANKAIQASRGASQAISGTVIYRYQ